MEGAESASMEGKSEAVLLTCVRVARKHYALQIHHLCYLLDLFGTKLQMHGFLFNVRAFMTVAIMMGKVSMPLAVVLSMYM